MTPNRLSRKDLWQNVLPVILIAGLVVLTFGFFEPLERSSEASIMEARSNYVVFIGLSVLLLVGDIVLPIPSSVVMYMNGLVLGVLPGMLLSLVSVVLASSIGYWMGRSSRFLIGTQKESSGASRVLKQAGPLTILLTRGIPVLSESVAIACGYRKFPFVEFSAWNALGYLPVCLIYSLLGHLAVNEYAFLMSFGASILVSLAFWGGYRIRWKAKKNVQEAQPTTEIQEL